MITKILTSLMMPPAGPLLLMLLGFVLRWRGRKRFGASCVAVGFLSLWALATPIVASALVRTLEDPSASNAVEHVEFADAIVVLGGGIGPAAPPRDSADLNESADRVLHAARLYRAGRAPLVVTTGGYPAWMGAVTPEGEATRELLIEWGVPDAAILVERGSLDTHQNAIATATLLAERDIRTVLLVTSALHMPRALATFRAAGVDPTPAPTDFIVTEGGSMTFYDWVPASEPLDTSRRALHEWVGRAYYALRGWS